MNGSESRELSIALYLTSDDRKADPQNHTVPVIDHFELDSEPETSFIVMPHLFHFDEPTFYAVDEALDFVFQTLQVRLLPCIPTIHEISFQGLVYMHSQGVAHR